MEENASNLDVVTVLHILRRRWGWILLSVIVVAGAAYGFSRLQRKQYTAAASVLFQNQQLEQQAAGLPGVSVADPQSQTDTNLMLATLPRIARATAAALHNGMTADAVSGAVNVSQQGDTDLATVSATAASPALAARIANEYAGQAIAYREAADSAYYGRALRAVNLQLRGLTPAQQQSPQALDLKDRAASLQVLAQLQRNEVQLAQTATLPRSPSSPKVVRNIVLGVLVGLLLGLGLAFGLERFDRRIRLPADLEAAYDLPLLGVVPETSGLKLDGSRRRALPERELEVFALLRAHLRYLNLDRELRVVIVASAAPGDGKSTIAQNLALAAASVGERVLLLEADLRRPTAAKTLGVAPSPGVAEVLVDGVSLDEAVQQAEFPYRGGQSVFVDVLVAGGILPPNPPQVTESRAMSTLLQNARDSYDLVLIDTPPLAAVSDAFPLLQSADGVLIVGRLGHNRSDVAARLRTTLETADAPLLGVVANRLRDRGTGSYGYGYRYDYRTRPTAVNGAGSEPTHVDPSYGTRPNGSSRPHFARERTREGGTNRIGTPADAPDPAGAHQDEPS